MKGIRGTAGYVLGGFGKRGKGDRAQGDEGVEDKGRRVEGGGSGEVEDAPSVE